MPLTFTHTHTKRTGVGPWNNTAPHFLPLVLPLSSAIHYTPTAKDMHSFCGGGCEFWQSHCGPFCLHAASSPKRKTNTGRKKSGMSSPHGPQSHTEPIHNSTADTGAGPAQVRPRSGPGVAPVWPRSDSDSKHSLIQFNNVEG